MRVTSFKRNCRIEKKYQPFCEEQIKINLAQHHGVTVDDIAVMATSNKSQQKKGIDFFALVRGHDKPITIDVKVRIGCEKYWGKDALSQDMAVEWRQTNSWGWANNPEIVSDYVMWVYPDVSSKYQKSIMVSHSILEALFPFDEGHIKSLARKYNCPMRKGLNDAGCYSHIICVSIEKMIKMVANHEKD